MSFIRFIVLLVFVSPLLFTCSCDTNILTGCSNNYDVQFSNPLGIAFLDKESNENLFHIRTIHYNYDSIALYQSLNPRIKAPNTLFIGHDGLITIDFINDEEVGVFNERIEKRFFFYFNYGDQDTIDIEYEFFKNKCKHQELSYFKIAYNDSVYFDGATDHVPSIHLLK